MASVLPTPTAERVILPIQVRLAFVAILGVSILGPIAHGCHGADEDTEPGVVRSDDATDTR